MQAREGMGASLAPDRLYTRVIIGTTVLAPLLQLVPAAWRRMCSTVVGLYMASLLCGAHWHVAAALYAGVYLFLVWAHAAGQLRVASPAPPRNPVEAALQRVHMVLVGACAGARAPRVLRHRVGSVVLSVVTLVLLGRRLWGRWAGSPMLGSADTLLMFLLVRATIYSHHCEGGPERAHTLAYAEVGPATSASVSESSSEHTKHQDNKDVHAKSKEGKRGEAKSEQAPLHGAPIAFDLNDYLAYMFFFPGQWNGPTLPHVAVQEVMDAPMGWRCNARFLRDKAAQWALYMALFFALEWSYTWSALVPAHLANSALRVPFLMIGVLFRKWRLITGFAAGEVACALAGVGAATGPVPAYGTVAPAATEAIHADAKASVSVNATKATAKQSTTLSPTPMNVLIDTTAYEKERNSAYRSARYAVAFDPWIFEMEPRIGLKVRAWNSQIQTFLALYVYKRLPAAPALLRRSLVMLYSAVWHGISGNYYFSLPVVATAQTCADYWMATFERAGAETFGPRPWALVANLLSHTLLNFIVAAFMADSARGALANWGHLGYFGLWLCFGLVVWAKLFNAMTRATPQLKRD